MHSRAGHPADFTTQGGRESHRTGPKASCIKACSNCRAKKLKPETTESERTNGGLLCWGRPVATPNPASQKNVAAVSALLHGLGLWLAAHRSANRCRLANHFGTLCRKVRQYSSAQAPLWLLSLRLRCQAHGSGRPKAWKKRGADRSRSQTPKKNPQAVSRATPNYPKCYARAALPPMLP